jgi:hypothetical protein
MTMSMQEISDRFEIQDLLVRYCYAIDTQDWDALDNVFTPDAFIDYSVFGGSSGDLETTKEFLGSSMPMLKSFQHMIAGSQIAIDGDTAEGKTMCHNPMVMDGGQLMFCGLWYRDRFVRTDAGWRIRERVEEKCYMHVFPT